MYFLNSINFKILKCMIIRMPDDLLHPELQDKNKLEPRLPAHLSGHVRVLGRWWHWSDDDTSELPRTDTPLHQEMHKCHRSQKIFLYLQYPSSNLIFMSNVDLSGSNKIHFFCNTLIWIYDLYKAIIVVTNCHNNLWLHVDKNYSQCT